MATLMLATSAAYLGLFAATAQAKPGPNFGNTCDLAFASSADPIYEPVIGHSHLFFGAMNVTNDSTGDTIRGTETSCNRDLNSSSYWMPQVYRNGNPLPVDTVSKGLGDNTIYYQAGDIVNLDRITVYPSDFEIVARDTNTGGDVKWSCDTGARQDVDVPLTEAPPMTCPADDAGRHLLIVRITFPQCWDVHSPDGGRVNEPDNGPERLRVANADGRCVFNGETWRAVPQISMSLNFTLPNENVGLIQVAGDDGLMSHTTMHADFMNGWDMTELNTLTVDCIKNWVDRADPDLEKPWYCADPDRIPQQP
jgi:hypothetical protein